MENQQETETFSQANHVVEDDYLTPYYSSSDYWELLAEMRI
nr:hypothetical protein [uncultured Dysosmobacter sp.]